MNKLLLRGLLKTSLLVGVLLVAQFFINTVSAQTLEPVMCFDNGLYEFQSVDVSLQPRNRTIDSKYKAGETVILEGYAENHNPYPVVDGYIFARLGRENDLNIMEGRHVIDEFYIAEKISIDSNSKKPINISWTVPTSLSTDTYHLDYFFTVDKRFNLAGLPFTNEIIAGTTELDVESENPLLFEINKTGTMVNRKPYQHIGGWPFLYDDEDNPGNDSLLIEQPITNLSNEDIEVEVNYEYYFWDSLREEDLIDTKFETLIIPADSTIDLVYERETPEDVVGYVKITVKSRDAQSMVNIRFVTGGIITRINYAATDQFPINKGDNFRAFLCLHDVNGEIEVIDDEGNEAYIPQTRIVTLTLKDEKGNIIASDTTNYGTTPEVTGLAMNVVSPKNYNQLELSVEINDEQGNLLDSYSTIYDCEDINSESCMQDLQEEYDSTIILYSILLIILIILIILILIIFKNKKGQKTALTVLVFLLVAASSVLVSTIVNRTDIVFAQARVSGTNQSRTQSAAKTLKTAGDRWLGNVDVARRLDADIKSFGEIDLSNLVVGSSFYVDVSSTCTFNATAGAWDTPYCGETVERTEQGATGGNPRYVKIRMSKTPFSRSISDTAGILSCTQESTSSNSYSDSVRWVCTANSEGSTQLIARVNAANSEVSACAVMDLGPQVTTNNPNNDNPNCREGKPDKRLRDLGYTGKRIYQTIGFEGNVNDRNITVPARNFSWNINVIVPEPTPGSCGVLDGNFAPALTEESTGLCANGDLVNFRNNGDTTYSWSCNGKWGSNIDVQCNTVPNPAIDGSISCRVEPQQSYYDGTETLNFTALLDFGSTFSDAVNIDWQWGGIVTSSSQQASRNLATDPLPDGDYTAWVRSIYHGVVNYAYCFANLDDEGDPNGPGDDDCDPVLDSCDVPPGITMASVPELEFDIPIRIADNLGVCVAELKIIYDPTKTLQSVECKIINEFGQQEGDNIGPITETEERTEIVRAGNSYKLECTPSESGIPIDSGTPLICVDPNIIER